MKKALLILSIFSFSICQAGFFSSSSSESVEDFIYSIAGEYSSSDDKNCHDVVLMLGSDSSAVYTGLSPEETVGTIDLRQARTPKGYRYGYTVHLGTDAEVKGNTLTFKTNHMGAEYGDVNFGKEWQRTEIKIQRKRGRLSKVEFATWKYNPLNPFSKKPIKSKVTGKSLKHVVKCRF